MCMMKKLRKLKHIWIVDYFREILSKPASPNWKRMNTNHFTLTLVSPIPDNTYTMSSLSSAAHAGAHDHYKHNTKLKLQCVFTGAKTHNPPIYAKERSDDTEEANSFIRDTRSAEAVLWQAVCRVSKLHEFHYLDPPLAFITCGSSLLNTKCLHFTL